MFKTGNISIKNDSPFVMIQKLLRKFVFMHCFRCFFSNSRVKLFKTLPLGVGEAISYFFRLIKVPERLFEV